jgi:hypothetical protein
VAEGVHHDYGWTQDDVYYVSWGASRARPLPEIYNTYWISAQQWQNLNVYAVSIGHKMFFYGAMTQQQACTDLEHIGICDPSIINSPAQGWQQLYLALNGNPATSQSSLTFVTDAGWNK